jgi:hypothetical protein
VRLKAYCVFTEKLEGNYITFWLRNYTKIKGLTFANWILLCACMLSIRQLDDNFFCSG